MSAIDINIVFWCVVLHVSLHTQVFIYNIGNYKLSEIQCQSRHYHMVISYEFSFFPCFSN